MKLIRNILLAITALLIQTTWAQTISVWDIKPDFVKLFIAYIALSEGAVTGTVFAFCMGFCQDIYIPEIFGIHAFVNTLLGFFLGELRYLVSTENIVVIGVILLVSCALGELLFLLLATSFQLDYSMSSFFKYGFFEAVYTSLIAVCAIQAKQYLVNREFLHV